MRRIGLVGFGSIAEHGHLPALRSFAEVDIVAVADVSPSRLDRARQLLPEAALFDDPLDLIARAPIDGVDICSPPNVHAGLIVAACRQGIADIVCEKPLVLSEEQYAGIARARHDSGSRVVSVNNWMYSDLHRHVMAAIHAGSIGTVRRVELRTGRSAAARGNDAWLPHWRTDLAYAGGGIILDHGWHQLYLLLAWLGASPCAVGAATRTVDARNHPVEDEAIIDLFFPSGTGRIELSWTASDRSNDGVIYGTEGKIAIYDDRIVVHNSATERSLPFAGRLTRSSYHPDWFQQMFRSTILDTDRREADRNFAEAGVLVGVIGAAYRSARLGGARCAPSTHRETDTENGYLRSASATP